MHITSAKFIKGIIGNDEILEGGFPEVAIIGRSNVGKSSLINALTGQKDLARTSSFPGRTRQINMFLINESFYLADLPGYGFSKGSKEDQRELFELINWYLFASGREQKLVVLAIDANVGPTDKDLEILRALELYKKNIIVAANKADKMKKTEYESRMQKIQNLIGRHRVVPCSSKRGIGIRELVKEIAA